MSKQTDKAIATATVNAKGTNSKRSDTKAGKVEHAAPVEIRVKFGKGTREASSLVKTEREAILKSGNKFLTDVIARSVKIGQYLTDAKVEAKAQGVSFEAWIKAHSDNLGMGRAQAFRYMTVGAAGVEKVTKLLQEQSSEAGEVSFSLKRLDKMLTAERREAGETVRGPKVEKAAKAPEVESGAEFPTPEQAASTVSESYLGAFLDRISDLTDEQLATLRQRVELETSARDDNDVIEGEAA